MRRHHAARRARHSRRRRLEGADRRAARPKLAKLIRERALAIGVGAASVREIDRLNIYHASTLAMRRALGRLVGRAGPRAHRRQGDSLAHDPAHGGRARRRALLLDRLRVDHREGHARPAHAQPGASAIRPIAGSTTSATPRRTTSQGSRRPGITPHHRRSFMRIRQLSFDFDAPRGSRHRHPGCEALDGRLCQRSAAGRSLRSSSQPNDRPSQPDRSVADAPVFRDGLLAGTGRHRHGRWHRHRLRHRRAARIARHARRAREPASRAHSSPPRSEFVRPAARRPPRRSMFAIPNRVQAVIGDGGRTSAVGWTCS